MAQSEATDDLVELGGGSAIRQSLQDIVDLYDRHLYPLLGLVGRIAPQMPIRQIAAEVRNCHTHLCWAYHHSDTIESDQVRRAFNHLLRAVVDAYKIVVDFVLDTVPGSAPLPAVLARFQAMALLREIWESPAHDQWAEGFATWHGALECAVGAVHGTYACLPEGFPDKGPPYCDSERRLVTDGGFGRLENALRLFADLLRLEHAYRVEFRDRMEGHSTKHLEFFDSLLCMLVGNDTDGTKYSACVQGWAATHRGDLVRQCAEAIGELMPRASAYLAQAELVRLADGFRAIPHGSLEAMESFHGDCVRLLRSVEMPASGRRFRWHGSGVMGSRRFSDAIAGYEGFADISESAVRSLYDAYLAAWDTDHSVGFAGFLDCLAGRIRDKGRSDPEDGVWAVLSEEGFPRDKVLLAHAELDRVRSDAKTYYELWHGCAAACSRQSYRVSVLKGNRPRAVWFADIERFSTDPEGERKAATLFRLADMVLQVCRDQSSDGSDVAFANTWGDCVLAVFQNPIAAAEAALSLIEHAAVQGIRLRVGASFGVIDVRENPIIGYDVSGQAVSEAARLEPIAEALELLATGSFLAAAPEHSGLKMESVSRTLAKPYGDHETGDEVQLLRISRCSAPI